MASKRLLAKGGAALVALALTASACGGDDDDTPAANKSTAAAADSNTTGTYQASDKKGGTLELLKNSDCDYWDPQRTYYGHCWNLQRFISRGLVTYAPKPGKASLVADLATEVPTSADGKTWTYKLRDGIKFEDGTPITSKDVKYGIQRVFATDVINGGPTYVVDELLGGDKYKGPYKDKAGLASIETPDDKTITFKLKRAFSDWNFVLAGPTSTPVQQAKDTGAKYTFRPQATGPYKIEKYAPNKSMSLIRNPQWDQATDEVRKALPDKINITMGLDVNDKDNRIASDQGDLDADGTGLQIATQAKVLASPTLKKRSSNPVQPTLRYLAVFTKVKPFDNIHCRKAVALIVNKKAQQLARGGPIGGGQVARVMSPPSLQYREEFNLYETPGDQGDVAKAKAELVQCGQPNGFKTKIAGRNNGKEVKQATALQADLKKIGIDATISQFDASQYYAAQLGIPANVKKAGFGVGFTAWGPDWPAPYGFFHFIVDGRAILPQGNSNYAELNLPAVNNAIDAALAAKDDAAKKAEWVKMDRAIVDSAAYIPLLYDKVVHLTSTRVTNAYVTDAYNGEYDYQALGVMP